VVMLSRHQNHTRIQCATRARHLNIAMPVNFSG
jgi:hypothetical protein